MASFLHDRDLTCICGLHCVLCSQTDFWKCFWTHAVISMTESCLFLMQCCLRIMAMQYCYSAMSPAHIDVSRFTESFGDYMYCRWWISNFKSTFFWDCSTICIYLNLWQSLRLRNSASFFHFYSYVTDLWPINWINCSIFLQQFFLSTAYFSSLLLLLLLYQLDHKLYPFQYLICE